MKVVVIEGIPAQHMLRHMEHRTFLKRVLEFRKNWPLSLAFSVAGLTCFVFILGLALEYAGAHGEQLAFMIVFLPLAIPGALFSMLLGLKHPLAVALVSCLVNGIIIWSAAFVVQTLISIFSKLKARRI